MITRLKEMGYEFVPVSKLIYKENYHIDSSGMQVTDESPVSDEK